MKILKSISLFCLVFILSSAFTVNKDGIKSVYVMGVSLCFGDSVVYFTEIQRADSITLTRDGFLPNREGYSSQLKSYLYSKDGNQNRTCVTYFSEKKANLQKTMTKLIKRYQNGNTVVHHIAPSDFNYVRPIDEY